MIYGSDPLLWLLLTALFLVFGLPLGFAAYAWVGRKQRRRLERSKRPVKITAGQEVVPEKHQHECHHKRSRSKARKGADGVMRSVCKWCGQPMKRNGPDDWEVVSEGKN